MSRWCRHMVVWAMLATLGLLCCAVVTEAGEPQEKIRSTVDAVLDLLATKDRSPQERRDDIRQAVLQCFDFEEMASRTLARHWRALSAAQRHEFVRLFTDLLERSYIGKIEQATGKQHSVKYTQEAIQDNRATVQTTIFNAHDLHVDVDYRLWQHNGNWQVYDVVIEGISLVNTYRTQFNKIIAQESYDGLIKKMQIKMAQEEATMQPPNSGAQEARTR